MRAGTAEPAAERWQDYVVPESLTGFLIRRNSRACRLLKCPACGRDFTDRWQSPRNPLSDHLLTDHSPEDFGLTREDV